MAHKKAGGSVSTNRDSHGKRLGIKVYGGQYAKAGSIVVRQRGTKFFQGSGTMTGRDHTIFAVTEGIVRFRQKLGRKLVDIVQDGR